MYRHTIAFTYTHYIIRKQIKNVKEIRKNRILKIDLK